MSLEKSVKKRYVEKKRTFLEKKWEEKNEIKIRNADQRLSNSLTTSMCGYSGAPPPSLPTPTHTHTHTHTNTQIHTLQNNIKISTVQIKTNTVQDIPK